MVGRFVEQQQFGVRGQDAGERQPGLLTAGERAEQPAAGHTGQPQAVHGRVHPRVGTVAVALLVRGQQVAVSCEFGLGRLTEALLRRT